MTRHISGAECRLAYQTTVGPMFGATSRSLGDHHAGIADFATHLAKDHYRGVLANLRADRWVRKQALRKLALCCFHAGGTMPLNKSLVLKLRQAIHEQNAAASAGEGRMDEVLGRGDV